LTRYDAIGIIPYMEPSELIKWRKHQKYTQQELADLLGVARMTVVRWERAMREIPPFLHLALRSLEKKGGGEKGKRTRKGTPKRRG
jgi:transcriptional regulator with XRE-family HTH domain